MNVPVWNDTNLVNLSNGTGNKFWTLAFIINGGGTCNPKWNGDTTLTGNNYGTYINSEGVFVFDGSNLSAKVAADPYQGIHIAPASDATGASGAWVRKYDGPVCASWSMLGVLPWKRSEP